MSLHIGRAYEGTAIEDRCPCPKSPCGLVDSQDTHPECREHPFSNAKTMRQGHPAGHCPEQPSAAFSAPAAA